MPNRRQRGEAGRFCKFESALTHQINARITEAHHLAYLKAGGSNWLRDRLEELKRQILTPKPTANRPFPGVQSSEPEPGGLYGFGGRLQP